MTALLLRLWKRLLLIGSFLVAARAGRATTFWSRGDLGNPTGPATACGRPLDDRALLIASRSARCGARYLLCTDECARSVVATVGDRGPYGKTRRGIYRAVVDVTPAVAVALGARRRAARSWSARVWLMPLDEGALP